MKVKADTSAKNQRKTGKGYEGMKRDTGIRLIGWLMAIMMLFGAISVPVDVSAQEKVVVQERDADGKKIFEFVKKLGSSILEEIPSGLFDWGMDLLLDTLFGLDEGMSEEERGYFDKIISQLNEIQTDIENIQKTLNDNTLAAKLNDFQALDHQTTMDILKALNEIERLDATPGKKAEMRKSILTDSLGIGTPDKWPAVNNKYDLYTMTIVNAMMTPIHLSLSGQISDFYLLQIHEEFLRRQYHWQHQALDELYAFQSNSVALLIQSLNIERLSLMLRIQLINDYDNMDVAVRPADWHYIDDTTVKNRLDDIDHYLGKAKDLFGAESTLYTNPHDPETERFYWYADGSEHHELLFDSQVTNQSFRQEDSGSVGCESWNCQGLKKNGYKHGVAVYIPVWDFWKSFFKPDDKKLITEDQAQMIFKDYGKKKNFYDIFIDEKEGNFQGLKIADPNATDWRLILDTEKHPIEVGDGQYCYHRYVYAYFMDAMYTGEPKDPERVNIAWYTPESNWIDNRTDWIGVHVKDPPANRQYIHLQVTSDGPEGWTEEDGDLELSIDKIQGSPESVTVDGKTLNKKYYKIAKRSVTISTAYLSTLSKDLHTFVIYASKGKMTYVLRIGKQAMLKLPAALKKIAEKAFAGIDAVNVMIPDSCKEIGAGAFKGCANLRNVYLPDDVKIGKGAFSGCPHVTFICSDGSVAAKYADQNGIPHRTP